MVYLESKKLIKQIILEGTPAEKQELYGFDQSASIPAIKKKFQLFAKSNFIRYFSQNDAPFHEGMIEDCIRSYLGENVIDLGFRGSTKTTLRKLIRVFLLLNDRSKKRKYFKILSRDLQNSRQIVTDIYNMLIELSPVYGNVFEKNNDQKREETMASFTLASGVKVTAGTVGQKQRGHIQDAYRPDWIWFEDVEDRESMASQAITENVIRLCDEAITGLAFGGSWELTGNYIFDGGTVQWFLNKKNTRKRVTPILTDYTLQNNKIVSGTPSWDIYTLQKIKELEQNAEDFWGDYMCLEPKTLINTSTGYKAISAIEEGELVLTHKGRYRPVSQVFKNIRDDLLDIHINDQVLTITPNHPVLVLENQIQKWKQAKDLMVGDVVIKITPNE